jgi:Flp pilus assembly protein TadD
MIEGHQAFRAGDFDGAAAAFANAVQASGGSSVAPLLNLAAAEERLGQLEGALGHLEQARRLEPSHPLVLFNLGTLLARSGRPAEAEPLLAELVKRSPADAEARSEWGLALVALGRLDDAERVFPPESLDEARCRRLREALAARPRSGPATGGAVAALGRRASACH